MKIILQKDVINLGDAGEVKEVADGYARNFLFPKKLAIRASEGSTKMALHQKRLADLKKEKKAKEMKNLSSQIDGQSIEIKVKTGENDKIFGSVTSGDISNALSAKGFSVDKRKIDLEQPIKALGEFKIKLRLAESVQATINLAVIGQG
ncbi:MAG: 50S ribosomal protein L9 [Leptospiraceae bacterium]|jgi:large subunit ribosomal protein L9|nr:50S ribosomal protein L9 [Leptospiraceae bacterium]MCZ8348077.1 50S ribosomal protein L9 [Leptospiraceae bacterium]PJE00121.1 MAG: 50S ribosomal protein L9 [Leptospira sp.]